LRDPANLTCSTVPLQTLAYLLNQLDGMTFESCSETRRAGKASRDNNSYLKKWKAALYKIERDRV